jgi:hypothetical protein
MKEYGKIYLGDKAGAEYATRVYLADADGYYSVVTMRPEVQQVGAYYLGYVDIYTSGVYAGTEDVRLATMRDIAEDWLIEQGIIKMIDGDIWPMAVASLVRSKRQELGFTQQKLGEAIGYAGRNAELMIQSIESGRRNVPTAKIKQLAVVLNVNAEDLIL